MTEKDTPMTFEPTVPFIVMKECQICHRTHLRGDDGLLVHIRTKHLKEMVTFWVEGHAALAASPVAPQVDVEKIARALVIALANRDYNDTRRLSEFIADELRESTNAK